MNRYSVELITEITVDAADRAEAERIAGEMTVRVLYDPRIVATKPAYVGLIHAVSSDDDTEAT